METLFFGDLTVEPSTAERLIKLSFRGKSNHREPGQVLAPYFAQVLEVALASTSKVELHFEAMDHLNSSTITALIHMIQDASKKDVPLVVAYDASQKWQKLSFSALRVLEKEGSDALTFRDVQSSL